MLSIMRAEWLPELIGPSGWTGVDNAMIYIALVRMFASACIILTVIRGRNELFRWLALALMVLFCGNVLSQIGAGRYTIGWSVSRISWVFSGSILFLYFMEQFVRQQRLLSRSRDALERAVAAPTSDLTEMVGQRDLLLREVHHRVKNNFQVINSLISFQAGKAETEETKSALARPAQPDLRAWARAPSLDAIRQSRDLRYPRVFARPLQQRGRSRVRRGARNKDYRGRRSAAGGFG
jgi:Histidine kinase